VTLIALVSGGQTGVDRGAIRAARELGLEVRGWCPPGRESEDGPIPEDVPLRETPEERSPDAPDVPRSLRTEWNVRDADATLVLSPAAGSEAHYDPGTAWATRCAGRYGKPLLAVDPWSAEAEAVITRWLADHEPRALNVAGPSEGTCPGLEEKTYRLVAEVLGSSG
jgi:hypothetical protein